MGAKVENVLLLLCLVVGIVLGWWAFENRTVPFDPGSVVSIVAEDGGYGSAFIVSSTQLRDGGYYNRAFTAAHCVAEGKKWSIWRETQKLSADAQLVASGNEALGRSLSDWAVVEFLTPDEQPVADLAPRSPSVGEQVLGYSYQGTGPYIRWTSTLTVSASDRLTGQSTYGGSGSPVIYRGRVVGMMRGIFWLYRTEVPADGLLQMVPLHVLQEAVTR